MEGKYVLIIPNSTLTAEYTPINNKRIHTDGINQIGDVYLQRNVGYIKQKVPKNKQISV